MTKQDKSNERYKAEVKKRKFIPLKKNITKAQQTVQLREQGWTSISYSGSEKGFYAHKL